MLLTLVLVLMIVGKIVTTQFGITDFDRLAEQALPYVLMVFGTEVALEVYVSMLAALLFAFFTGRLIPRMFVASILQNLGVRWRFLQIRGHRGHLGKLANLGVGIVRLLTFNKFLTLGAALNTPGNSVLGGGGGLALLAGASGQFSFAGFGMVAAIAIAPIPLAFALFG